VTARSKVWICWHLLVGIVGSNPEGGNDICLSWVLCIVRYSRLITLPQEFFRLCCVQSAWSRSPVPGSHDLESGRRATEENKTVRVLRNLRFQEDSGVWLYEQCICTRRELTAVHPGECLQRCITLAYSTLSIYHCLLHQQCQQSYQFCPRIILRAIVTLLPRRREQIHGWQTLHQKNRTGTVVWNLWVLTHYIQHLYHITQVSSRLYCIMVHINCWLSRLNRDYSVWSIMKPSEVITCLNTMEIVWWFSDIYWESFNHSRLRTLRKQNKTVVPWIEPNILKFLLRISSKQKEQMSLVN
jgi:hypothetical protein